MYIVVYCVNWPILEELTYGAVRSGYYPSPVGLHLDSLAFQSVMWLQIFSVIYVKALASQKKSLSTRSK